MVTCIKMYIIIIIIIIYIGNTCLQYLSSIHFFYLKGKLFW
jgi:hypothetical protein